MRYSIETAPRDGKVVILEDIASVTFDVAHWSSELGRWVDRNGDPSKIRPTHWFPLGRDKYLLQENEGSSNLCQVGPSPLRSRWSFAASSIAVAFVVAALVGVNFHAEDSRKANLLTLQQQVEADQANPQAVAQEAAQAKQDREGPALRDSLNEERRIEVLANELAQARRAINRLNLQLRAGVANSAELLGQEREKTATLVQAATAARHELEEERARGAALTSELAKARSETETNVALLNKARDEAVQFNQTPEWVTAELQQERDSLRTEAANFAQLLGQERERAATIAQEAAAARQELAGSAAQHRQAFDEERARVTTLASELTTARTEIETQAAQLRKTGDETKQLKQAIESTTAELQQERDSLRTEAANFAQLLGQERERTSAIAQEAAVARQELAGSAAQHRQALDEERARVTTLASELTTARTEIETQAAQLRKTGDETKQLKQAIESTTAELQQERDSLRTEAANFAQLLGQERERTSAIAQEAEAARQELIASTEQHRQTLNEESARRAALWSELAVAQRAIETQAALLAHDETRQLEQITELTTLELQQERDSLRTDAANSAELIGQEQQQAATFVHAATAARYELEEERVRGAALASELAIAHGETLLSRARDNAAEFDQTPEMAMAELQHARDSAEALWMAEESALGVMEVRTTLEHAADSQTTQVMQTADLAAPEQPEATVSQDGSEAARLMVRARGLLGQGDIGAARIVLEHVAESGSAQASFALAETYDPIILFTWGTYGTRGDAMKARELYAKAHAGGIREAKTRFDALDQ